ncbi:MAG: hypothetical protein COT25_02370 [Candidatus Kerfeldbacteria bacterium CG08_land_8_20_14_0_20_42_7]|uniref:Uncharacterized protein n=1 Tax=Candidatus Kerfeldbacteria bacterium CG08_land_8_20_14_0_20_42_7 TaxID=2014245 RepID=A0A2H0YSY1_9BACT|nr:MAG: hypothetical protein COT25_02370 [Candidatus Kerfeldbacteria bacterium CG08_land_8_20_14_0_20_42_7]
MKRYKKNQKKGFTFIETLIGVSLLLSLIIVSGAMVKVLSISHKLRLKQTAYSVLSEEITYLRSLPYDQIVDVVDQPFRGILYHKGQFEVTVATSQSSPNAIHASRRLNGDSNTITALTTPPVGPIAANATYAVSFFIPSTNQPNWQFGFPFRAIDENNMYFLKIDENSIDLVLHENSGLSTIYTTPQIISEDTWHIISITGADDIFTITLDGSPVNGSPIVDATFAKGGVGISTFGVTDIYFDNVSLQTSLTTYIWNFDEAANEVGSQPNDWKRSGLYDLPTEEAKLTISDEAADPTSPLKNIYATISWDDGSVKSASIETYVAQTGISK